MKIFFKLGHEMNGAARGKNMHGRSMMELYIVYVLISLKISSQLDSVVQV